MGWYTKNKVNHHLLRLPEDTYADDEPKPRLVELTVDWRIGDKVLGVIAGDLSGVDGVLMLDLSTGIIYFQNTK